MQYFLSDQQLLRIERGLKAAIAIPFIDDIEDYIVEAILEYAKEIDGVILLSILALSVYTMLLIGIIK